MKLHILGSKARFYGGIIAACLCFAVTTQAATYYVATTGNNGNGGSIGSPWQTIGYGFSQLSAGDTLNIRAGTYRETDLAMAASGTSGNPITVQAYESETVIINPSYPAFETTGAGSWTLHDAATNTYKSTATYSDTAISAVWEETSGKRVRLVNYSALSNLMSNNENWSSGGYTGPGIYKASGSNVIYIRLKASDPAKIFGVTADAPPESNPNNLKIYICSRDKSLIRHTGGSANKYWVFNRLQFLFAPTYDTALGGSGASQMTFTDCIFAAPDFSRGTFIFRNSESFWLFDGCEAYGYVPRWVAWTDVKLGSRVATSMKVMFASFGGSNFAHDIVFQNGSAIDFFDGWNVLSSNAPYNLKWLNNHFRVRDDVIQIGGASHDYEFAYNFCEISGPGRDGDSNAPQDPNNCFIHHNIFDTSDFQLWGRAGEKAATGEADGLVGKKVFATHSVGGKIPWKIYNNTILHYGGSANWGLGDDRAGSTGSEAHSFLNNIVLQGNDRWVSRDRQNPNLDEYDYNIYHELVPTPTKVMFQAYNGGNYDTLAAAQAAVSQWEQHSSQVDPELADFTGGDWRPSSSGPAASGAADLSSRGWPGTSSVAWRGAVDPNAGTGTGDVGPGSGGSAPAVPTGLSATALSSSAINLIWTDASSDETGFKIERKTSGSYSLLDTVGAGVETYDDTGLAASTEYFYQLRSYNANGTSAASTAASATTDSESAPCAPSSLAASTVSSSQIDLAWTDNSGNETAFEIERKIGSGGTWGLVTTVAANTTSYGDTGLAASSTYYYRVNATNAGGDSSYSNEDNATTSSASPPSAPSGLSASTVSSSQVNLTWTDNSGDETAFKIEFKIGSGGTWMVLTSVAANATSYSDTGLAASTTYYYRVSATNGGGDSSASNEDSATTLSSGGDSIAVRGAAGTNTGSSGTGATSITVNKPSGVVSGDYMLAGISVIAAQTITPPSGWTLVRTIVDTMQLSVYGKVAGGSEPADYTWSLGSSKKMSGGIVAFSGVDTITPIQTEDGTGEAGSASTTHSTPTITTTGSSTWLVSLFGDRRDGGSTWTPPAGTTEHVDERTGSSNNDPSVEIVSVGPVSVGNHSHTATASGSSTYAAMEIIALNASGGGSPPPDAPSDLSATAVSSSQINLAWTDNSSDETGFEVEYKVGSGGTWTALTSVAANTTSYNHTGLSSATTYYYRVNSTKAGIDSTYSNEDTGTTFEVVPAAPSGLSATAASSSQIDLTWADNASNESGFEIESKIGAGGTWTTVDTVTADTTSFSDVGLSASTTYHYRVRAYNSAGSSSYSSEDSASTDSGGGSIVFLGAESATTGNGTATSITVNKPSGVTEGDYMLAGVSVIAAQTITPPSGWTLVRTTVDVMQLSVYSKVAGSSEPSDYTWTVSSGKKWVAGIVAFSGVSSIQDEASATQASGSSASHTTATLTTTGSSTWLVSFFGDRRNGGSTWTPPSGAAERVDVRCYSNTNDPSLEINTQGPVTAGDYSHTATANASSGYAAMEIIALQP